MSWQSSSSSLGNVPAMWIFPCSNRAETRSARSTLFFIAVLHCVDLADRDAAVHRPQGAADPLAALVGFQDNAVGFPFGDGRDYLLHNLIRRPPQRLLGRTARLADRVRLPGTSR